MAWVGNTRRFWIVFALFVGVLPVIFTASAPSAVYSQSGDSVTLIESDDGQVVQSGMWTAQSTSEASGGSYLYSSGSADDVLTLEFYGTSVEILYVEHASFGSFAIDIDNTIRRTVTTTNQTTTFDNRAAIDYLEAGHHTLRVYPVEGVIAIDAFVANAVATEIAQMDRIEAGICNPDQLPIRASAAPDGSVNNGNSLSSDISDDGRYVVFSTAATNIVPNNAGVILYDRQTCSHTLVSVSSDGQPVTGGNPRISGDGQYVVFSSSSDILTGEVGTRKMIFVHNLQTGETEPISIGWDGSPADANADNPTISDDGRYIAFESGATNLVPNDPNGSQDIFVYDRQTDTTLITSVSTLDAPSNSISQLSEISGNGHFVVFVSSATNLIDGDITPSGQVYVHDLLTGETTLESVSTEGEVADGSHIKPTISDDGRFVAFEGYASNLVPGAGTINGIVAPKIYLHDRQTGETTLSPTNPIDDSIFWSIRPSISGNGQFVTFLSYNVEIPSDGGGVYVYDRINNQTRVMATTDTGRFYIRLYSEGPEINFDGTFVTFNANATDITDDDNNIYDDVYVASTLSFSEPTEVYTTGLTTTQIEITWTDNTSSEIAFHLERTSNGTEWVKLPPLPANTTSYVDNDVNCGQKYLYRIRAEDTNGQFSPYSLIAIGRCRICDAEQTIFRASAAPDFSENDGESRFSDISNDGRYTVFRSYSTNFTTVPDIHKGIYLYDHTTCDIKLISDFATGEEAVGELSAISGDGNFVVFTATGTVNETSITDGLVVYDVQAETHSIVSINSDGDIANNIAQYPSISDDGRYVAFDSIATNLVPNDTNAYGDVFVHDRQTGETTRVSVSSNGDEGNGGSGIAEISGNGQFVVFLSSASNLVENDTNLENDAFVHNRTTGETTRVSVTSLGEESEEGIHPTYWPDTGPSISGDGRYIVFVTSADDLIPVDDNPWRDVFLHDRQTGETRRVSENPITNSSSAVSEFGTISGNGQYIAITYTGNDLVDGVACITGVYIYDQFADEMYCPPALSRDPSLSDDGTFITFSGDGLTSDDTDDQLDIYVAQIPFIAPPTNLQTSIQSTTEIRLQWTDKSSNETAFHIERSTDGTNWTEIATVAENNASYTDTIVCNINYHYRIRAFDATTGTFSSYSNTPQITSYCPLSAPSNLTATASSTIHIDLNWTDSIPNESTFRIERSLNGTDWTEITIVPTDTNAYEDTVDCGTTYHYRVRAFRSADGEFSDYSNVDQETTADCPVCNPDQLPVRASAAANGSVNNNHSFTPDISDDGRYVVFSTHATNILSTGTGVTLYDRETCSHTLVSLTSEGYAAYGFNPKISGDGRFVVFSSSSDVLTGEVGSRSMIFVHDRQTSATEPISIGWDGSPANNNADRASISDDGRYVEFESEATNLVPNDTNDFNDIFVYDRQTGTTVMASVSSTGIQGDYPSEYAEISGNGRFVVFTSIATNLLDEPLLSINQIYVHDLQTGETSIVSVSSLGEPSNSAQLKPSISDDGRYVAFESYASNLVSGIPEEIAKIYLHDRLTGQTTHVPTDPDDDSSFEAIRPSISGDGQVITFLSNTADQPIAQGSIYAYSRLTNQSHVVASSANGRFYVSYFDGFEISADGSLVTFITDATDITTDDQNTYDDIYVAALNGLTTPTDLQVTAISSTKIDLSWTDNSPAETAFHIERSLNGTDWAEITIVPTDTNAYQDTVDCGTTYHYRVRAFRSTDSLFSPYSNTDQATTDICIPANPTLIAPINVTITDLNALPPTFEWNEAAETTWYRFYLTKPSGVVLDNWYQKGNSEISCNGITCSLTPQLTYTNDSYTWYINGWGPNGFTEWTAAGNFTIDIPLPNAVNKTAPADTSSFTDPSVTFTWDHDPNATWYRLWISGTQTWYDAPAICDTTCTVSQSLNNGGYVWYVQAYGPAGLGSWGSGFTFTIAVPPPSVINKSAPIGTISSATPTFEWQRDTFATWYQIWVGNSAETSYLQWHEASTICNITDCSLDTGLTFIGDYSWYIRGWSNGGLGDWGTGADFDYTFSLIAPTGNVSGVNISYEWDDLGTPTTWYRLWVGVSGGSTVLDQWVEATSVCNGATCSVPASSTLPAGNYIWYVQPYGDYGYGAWTAGPSFTVTP